MVSFNQLPMTHTSTTTEAYDIFDHYDVARHYNGYIVTNKETGEDEIVENLSEFDFVDDEAAAYLIDVLGELPDSVFDEATVKDYTFDDPCWTAAALEHMSRGNELGIDWAKEYVEDMRRIDSNIDLYPHLS